MDKYLDYLRAKLRGKVDLLVTEDIIAHPEGQVASAGDTLDQKSYRNLSRLKLNKPLESCIKVAEQLNTITIYQEINNIVDKEGSLHLIDEQYGKASVLEECCNTLKKFPYLLEIVSILKIEVPELYQQSLLSAYMAYLIGLIGKYPQEKIEAAFLAGLLHDIGLLFINRSCLLDKQKRLTAKEWREMQLHPIIAYKLLKSVDEFPKSSLRAILEHHERPDGSGYPLEKQEGGISELSSLISLLDDVIVIYNKRFKPLGRSIQNIIPVIQMNTFGYEQSCISSLTKALKSAPEPALEEIDTEVVKSLINYTYQQQLYINKIVDVIDQINDIVGFNHNSKSVTAIQNMSSKIASVIASSGLQESSYVELLQRLTHEDHQHLHLEVEQTRLMLDEVIYQLQSYYKASNVYSSKKSNSLADKIGIFIDVFNATERPTTPEELVQYWQQLEEKNKG